MAISWQALTAGGAFGRAGSETIDRRTALRELDTIEKARAAYELGLKELDLRKNKRRTASERLDFLETMGITGKGAAALARFPEKYWDKEVERLLALAEEMPKTVPGLVGTIPPEPDSPVAGDWTVQEQMAGAVPIPHQERMERFGFTGKFIDPAELPEEWKEKILDDLMGHLPPVGTTKEDETDIRTSFADRFFGPIMADPSDTQRTTAERLGISVREYQTMMEDTYRRPAVEGVTYARRPTEAEGRLETTAELELSNAQMINEQAIRTMEQNRRLDEPASEEDRTVTRIRFNKAENRLETYPYEYPPMSNAELAGQLQLDKARLALLEIEARTKTDLRDAGAISSGQSLWSKVIAGYIVQSAISIDTDFVTESGELIGKEHDVSAFGRNLGFGVAAAANQYFRTNNLASQTEAELHITTNRDLIDQMSSVAWLERVAIPAYNRAHPNQRPLSLTTLSRYATYDEPAQSHSAFESLLGGDWGAITSATSLGLTPGYSATVLDHLRTYYAGSDDEREGLDNQYRKLIGNTAFNNLMPSNRLQLAVPPAVPLGISPGARGGAAPDVRGAAPDAAPVAAPVAEGVDPLTLRTQLNLVLQDESLFDTDRYAHRGEQLREIWFRYSYPKSENYIKPNHIRKQVEKILEDFGTAEGGRLALVSVNELREQFRNIELTPAAEPVPAAEPGPAPAPELEPVADALEPAAEPEPVVSLMRPQAVKKAEPLLDIAPGPVELYKFRPPPSYGLGLDDPERNEQWQTDNERWKGSGVTIQSDERSDHSAWKRTQAIQKVFNILSREARFEFPLELQNRLQELEVTAARQSMRSEFINPLIERLIENETITDMEDLNMPQTSLEAVWKLVKDQLTTMLYQTYIREVT
jgi:hypothetical protein